MKNDSDSSRRRSGNPLSPLRWPLFLIIFSTLAVLLSGVVLGPATPSLEKARENAAMQATRTIALAMFQFANEHGGRYPNGGSSTQVFQQLLDGNYIADPTVFYVQMPGKTKPASTKLEPRNASFDVTVPANSSSPPGLPLVFLTGYRVHYLPNGSAVPLSGVSTPLKGLAVCYKSNDAFFKPSGEVNPTQNLQNFIPSDFNSEGEHFQQLTPDGPLP